MNKNQEEIIELLKKLNTSEDEIDEITTDNYQIKITTEHYVEEFYKPSANENVSFLNLKSTKFQILNRKKYVLYNLIYAFQFFDLTTVRINNEILTGTINRKNETPIIYMGKRIFLKPEYVDLENLPFNSFIITDSGQIHRGDNGITYQEYLDYLKENKRKYTRKKEKIDN